MDLEPLHEQIHRSRQRRADNELVFKQSNERVGRLTQRLFSPEDNQDVPIGFVCECSSLDCQERISLVFKTYKTIRKHKQAFIVCPGHYHSEIEDVVEDHSDYQVVVKKAKYQPKL